MTPSDRQPDPDNPIFETIVSRLAADRPVIYSKINHGLWERLVWLEAQGHSLTGYDEPTAARMDIADDRHPSPHLFGGGFFSELRDVFRALPDRPDHYIFAAGTSAWPGSNAISGTPKKGRRQCEDVMSRLLPEGAVTEGADGLEIKAALVRGRFPALIDQLKGKRGLFIGNASLSGFAGFFGFDDCRFLEIDPVAARRDRHDILESASTIVERDRIQWVCFQAGGNLTAWLIHTLHRRHPDVSLIDLGICASLCNPRQILSKHFGQVYRQPIVDTIRALNPDALPSDSSDPLITGRQRFEPDQRSDLVDAKVEFVENKTSDYARITELMAVSEAARRHANFGPVSRQLERWLERRLELPEDRAVVMCSSCTTGLHTAAGVHALRAGRALSWTASAFGFMSTNIGPWSGISLTDCDIRGQLPEDAGQGTDDGLLYTHVFGRGLERWTAFRTICRDAGKALIVDNALGLLARPPGEAAPGEIEVVSCHQTKPWGVGEGGFMILDRRDADTARQLLNFGVKLGDEARPHASNGKISDLACAAILDRLERLDAWNTLYRLQKLRVRTIIAREVPGLRPLLRDDRPDNPAGSLPYLAKNTIPMEALDNPHFVMRKYYRPLENRQGDTFPNAEDIFDRIVCIPCHPDMRHVGEYALIAVLRGVVAAATG